MHAALTCPSILMQFAAGVILFVRYPAMQAKVSREIGARCFMVCRSLATSTAWLLAYMPGGGEGRALARDLQA